MRKLTLLLSSFLGSITGLFSQDILPFVELPDSLNPFLNVSGSNRLTIGDINGDGNDDIIFYRHDLDSFRHFVDSGNGQIQEIDSLNSPIQPLFEALEDFLPSSSFVTDFFFADVDSDGDSDAVFEVYDSSFGCSKYNYVRDILIFENNGNGAFNTNPGEEIILFSECAYDLHVRFIDVDNDGDLDILKETSIGYYYSPYYSTSETNYELLRFNEFSGEFENEGQIEGAPYFGEIYDINNDGFDDIIASDEIRLNTGVDLNFDQLPDLSIADEIFPFNLNSSEFNNFLFGLGNFDNDQFVEILAWSSNLSKWRLFSQNCAFIEGTSCNVEEDCIVNGIWQDCNCIGEISPDSDGDGFCDAIDQCPGADDNIDSDQDGIPDCIDQTNGDCTLNEPCDDGSDCTLFESLDENCNCVEEPEPWFPDSDGDGICNLEDVCPGQNDNIDNDQNGIPDCLEIQNTAELEEYGEDVPTGIDEQIELQRQIQIFPNPSSGIFTIQSHLKIEDIRLFTNLGKEIPIFITDQKQIDLGLFSNGIYIIELRTEAGILRKKIAKQ